ncbi:MAG: response regulator [Desulfuromonadales bacterium]|nr:response regulator [Desulfuromonadales bacterium]
MTPPPIKILAVDNEQLLLWALQRAFKGRSLDIQTAASAEQALAEIGQGSFDLFLLGFDWHEQSDLQLLQTVDEHCPYVPVILMTTSAVDSGQLNDAIRATRKHGAWHLLEKPFSLDRMLQLIEVNFQDQDKARACQDVQVQDYAHENRHYYRRPHVQPINFSFKTIVDGESRRVETKGILTDISDCGSGMLANVQLQANQVLSFGDDFAKRNGVVAWSVMIAENTYRCGLQFC